MARRLLITTFLIVALDQISKGLILKYVGPGEVIEVIPRIFNLTLTFNKGAAFGFLANTSDTVRLMGLFVATVTALSVVGYFLMREYRQDACGQIALAMVLGGAFGNIIDRLRFGAVVDFLDIYYSSYHWPAFNIADSAICIGVAVLILKRPAKKDQITPAGELGEFNGS